MERRRLEKQSRGEESGESANVVCPLYTCCQPPHPAAQAPSPPGAQATRGSVAAWSPPQRLGYNQGMMKVLSAEETAALLPYPALADELARMLGEKAAGRATAPARLALPLAGGGALLLMPAAGPDLAITKIVTVHPGNAAHGLPSVQAEVLLFEAATGRRLLWLDGAVVTARRTAALSLLAARRLAPNPA